MRVRQTIRLSASIYPMGSTVMKNRPRTATRLANLAVVAGLWVGSTLSDAHAQIPRQGIGGGRSKSAATAPYQQRLSPYLDLLRADNSALSPYHSFVQPRQQMRLNQNRQAAQIQSLGRMIPSSGISSGTSDRIQTGRGGTFNNFLHYYPIRPTTVR